MAAGERVDPAPGELGLHWHACRGRIVPDDALPRARKRRRNLRTPLGRQPPSPLERALPARPRRKLPRGVWIQPARPCMPAPLTSRRRSTRTLWAALHRLTRTGCTTRTDEIAEGASQGYAPRRTAAQPRRSGALTAGPRSPRMQHSPLDPRSAAGGKTRRDSDSRWRRASRNRTESSAPWCCCSRRRPPKSSACVAIPAPPDFSHLRGGRRRASPTPRIPLRP